MFSLSEAQPKYSLITPPQKKTNFGNVCKRFIESARVSEHEAQFSIFYNFIIFKLCSTTEQMPALVFHISGIN
jgi:hypothetical protein